MPQHVSIAQAEYATAASLTAALANAQRFAHGACDDRNFVLRTCRNVTYALKKIAARKNEDSGVRRSPTQVGVSGGSDSAIAGLCMESFLAPRRGLPGKACQGHSTSLVVQGVVALDRGHSVLAKQIRGAFSGALDLLGEARSALTTGDGIPFRAIAEFFNIPKWRVESEVLPRLEPHFAKLTIALFELLREGDEQLSATFDPATAHFYAASFPDSGQLQFHGLEYPKLTPEAQAQVVLHESVHLALRGRDLFYLPALQQRDSTSGDGTTGQQAAAHHAFLMRPENQDEFAQNVRDGGVGEQRFNWILGNEGELRFHASIRRFYEMPEAKVELLLHNPDSVVALVLILAGRAGK